MSEEIIQPQHAAPQNQNAEQVPSSPFHTSDGPPVEANGIDDSFTWSAPEYIAHHKDMQWYGAVVAITIILVALIYVITRDRISAITIFILGIIFCLAAARKPRILTYILNHDGLTVGHRFYPYSSFKSYSIRHEGTLTSVDFIPMKRFMPLASIYCPPNDEAAIVELLAEHVPYEERRTGYIDQFSRRIRF